MKITRDECLQEMNVAKPVNIFKAVKKGQEKRKNCQNCQRQGKAIKVMRKKNVHLLYRTKKNK